MSARLDAVFRLWALGNRAWPFSTPPDALGLRDLLAVEARMIAALPIPEADDDPLDALLG